MKQRQVIKVIYENGETTIRMYGLRRFFRKFRTNKKYKDRLFIRIFQEKKELLKLYNAVNHSDYTNLDDLIIITLEDAIYMKMKNDCSFLIGNYMNLYEHQSTFNPNMPLRGFLYFAAMLQGHLAKIDANIYGHKLIKIPTPKYIVFYNGTEEQPDRMEMRLSDAFENLDGCMEFTAVMLNINLGHNQELMAQCKQLEGYSVFVEKVRYYKKLGYAAEKAVDAAAEYCIEHDILAEFLQKNRNEVRDLILTEYNEKKHMEMERRDSRQEGLEEGIQKGLEEGIQKGLEEGLQTTAYNMLKKGLSIDLIQECTGLSKEEIHQLGENIK